MRPAPTDIAHLRDDTPNIFGTFETVQKECWQVPGRVRISPTESGTRKLRSYDLETWWGFDMVRTECRESARQDLNPWPSASKTGFTWKTTVLAFVYVLYVFTLCIFRMYTRMLQACILWWLRVVFLPTVSSGTSGKNGFLSLPFSRVSFRYCFNFFGRRQGRKGKIYHLSGKALFFPIVWDVGDKWKTSVPSCNSIRRHLEDKRKIMRPRHATLWKE